MPAPRDILLFVPCARCSLVKGKRIVRFVLSTRSDACSPGEGLQGSRCLVIGFLSVNYERFCNSNGGWPACDYLKAPSTEEQIFHVRM